MLMAALSGVLRCAVHTTVGCRDRKRNPLSCAIRTRTQRKDTFFLLYQLRLLIPIQFPRLRFTPPQGGRFMRLRTNDQEDFYEEEYADAVAKDDYWQARPHLYLLEKGNLFWRTLCSVGPNCTNKHKQTLIAHKHATM